MVIITVDAYLTSTHRTRAALEPARVQAEPSQIFRRSVEEEVAPRRDLRANQPSSRYRVDGVEVGAMIQHEGAAKLDLHTGATTTEPSIEVK